MIPPILYLPTREFDQVGTGVEVRELDDGRRALISYTALDRLLDACGYDQPWVAVPVEKLADIKESQPFDTIAFDPAFADHLRSGGRLA